MVAPEIHRLVWKRERRRGGRGGGGRGWRGRASYIQNRREREGVLVRAKEEWRERWSKIEGEVEGV